MLKKVLLAVAGFASAALAQTGYPDADLVKELWQQPDISFGLYSGYLPIGTTKKQLHYTATLSKKNVQTDPVIVFLGGDLGCSSLIHYSLAFGPYIFKDNEVNLSANPFPLNI